MEKVITAENFNEEVVQGALPVLLDFWAEWCGPCRMLAPVVAEIAQEKAGALVVGKVNVDDERGLAARFSIESIPTVLLLRQGKVVAKSVGYVTKEQLCRSLGL